MVGLPNNGDMRSPSSPKGRRIVVSHRLPLCVVPSPDATYGFDFSLDPDALPLKHSRGLPGGVVFVGTLPASAASVPASEELAAHLLERFSCIPVFLEEHLHKDYYHGFCMKYLWPLFHDESLRSRRFDGGCGTDFNSEQYRAYISANRRFAERVLELLVSPDEDHVYIHDYHLLTLPSILRQESPGTRIYFTLHSAFPRSDIFCSSPIANDLLCNLLNADLLAFVSSSWDAYSSWYDDSGVKGFLSTCSRLLNLSYHSSQGCTMIDYLDRTVVVKSITASSGEVCHLREMMSLPETASKVRETSTKYRGRKLMLDVEDSLPGSKLVAMEKLLELQAELRGKVVLVKINNTRRHVISTEVLAIRDRINSRFGFPGYEPVVVIDDDPPMHDQLALYTLADVFIAKASSARKFSYYTVCRQEGPLVADGSADAPRNGTIIATGTFPRWKPLQWLPSGAIRVTSYDDDGTAMADALGSVLRMNEEEKQLLQEKHYSDVTDQYNHGYWPQYFEENLEMARRFHESAKILARCSGKQISPVLLHSIYDAMAVRPWELDKLATTLEMIRMAKKKVSTSEDFFSLLAFEKPILSMYNKYRPIIQDYDDIASPRGLKKATNLEVFGMSKKKMSTCEGFFSRYTFMRNNNPKYHRACKSRSVLQGYYYYMVSLQGLNKATTLEEIRVRQAVWSDPNYTTSFLSGRRKDKPIIIWLALHEFMSAESSQRKNSTFSERIPSYLAQLVAACNSSASAGQSGMALLHPSRRPLIRFLLDSGASMHVVGDAGLLHHLRHLPRAAARFATLPDGSRLPIIGIGTIQMDGFSIPNVYLVEGVTVNLVSVSRLAMDHNICCCFYRNQCQLMLLADGTRVGEAVLEDDGVYGLRFLRIPQATV